MSLSPRLIAIQGIGFTPLQIAVQGLLDYIATVQPERPLVVPAGGFGTAIASGPDALLSMADYLRRFGKLQPVNPPSADVSTRRKTAQRKRQRQEEELLLLGVF